MAKAPPPFAVLRGHEDAVVSVKFISEHNLLSGGANGDLRIWDLRTYRTSGAVNAHYKSILSICELSCSELITSSRDGTIKIWNLDRLESPKTILHYGYDHFCNTIVQGSQHVISPGVQQSQIIVWDLRDPRQPSLMLSPGAGSPCGMVTALSNLPSTDGATDGSSSERIAAGYEDGSVHLFDLRRPSGSAVAQKLHSEPVFALASAWDTGSNAVQVVSGGGDSLLRRSKIYNNGDEWSMKDLDQVELPHPGTSCVRYRPDQRILMSAHWDHTVRVFDRKRLKPLAVLRHHRDNVYAVDFASTALSTRIGSELEGPSREKLEGDSASAHRAEHAGPYDSASISPAVFATASKDHTIALWDLFADSYN